MKQNNLEEVHKAQTIELTKIINAWDPYGLLAEGTPADEFSVEISEVLAGLRDAKSTTDVAKAVSRVFSERFDPKGFSADKCDEVAARIYGSWKVNRWLPLR